VSPSHLQNQGYNGNMLNSSSCSGILSWKGSKEDEVPLQVGQRLRIWPNHACVAGAGHGCYLIIDSSKEENPDVILDVWTRWHGY
jgi:D-serine ammonia-lyase